MAVKDRTGEVEAAARLEEAMHSRGTRRMYFGTNVLLTVLFALVLLVLVNWLAQRRYYRRDLSSLGAYRLSDRTKNIIDSTEGKIRLTSIYTSDDPEKDRDTYLPRVRDLFEEFRQYTDRAIVEHISEDAEKRELAARLEATFSQEATQHREAIDRAKKLCEDLKAWAADEVARFFAPVEVQNGWLTRFTSFTNSRINLQALGKTIDAELEKVQSLITGDLPKYAEANNNVKSLDQELKSSLESIGQFLSELGKLTRSVEAGQETFFAGTPAKLKELDALRAELVKAVGAVNDPMPEDPVPALKECAKVCSKLSTWLVAEIGRINEFTERHPVISQHPLWQFRRRVAILVTQTTLPQLLGDVQEDLADLRPQITRILSADLDQRKLQNTLEQLRQLVAQFDATLKEAAGALVSLQEDFAQIDDASRVLLSAEHYESQFKPQIDALGELATQIDELPELRIGELGDQLRQDNVIVVEANGKAKVVTFDETWPFAGQDRFSIETGERKRIFNGDGAVSQALLTVVNDKPFGTVVVTHYEPDIPERMRPFVRPVAGDIPMFVTSDLQERLGKANFEVKIWNIARDPQHPEVQEGVPVIYLVLPPPDPRNVPPGMGPQIDTWGQEDEKKLTDRIGKTGRAIFLATYSVPRPAGPFGGGPLAQFEYVLKDYLHNQWGIDVDVNHRVIYGKRDPKDPARFGVSLADWQWLPLNSFTDHPIGRPLRARRVYMLNVCPVSAAETPPPGVEAWDVLRIEDREDIWGNQNVLRTVQVITDPRSGGWVGKDFDPSDGWMDIPTPFSVMAAARNTEGGKVFVTGAGQSYVDGYLDTPIARGAINERITFDPPPTANADLLVNALFWLADRENLIASGPILTPVIRPVSNAERRWLGAGVLLWSLLSLAGGGAVLFVRRK